MTDTELSLWKPEMPDINSLIVAEMFGGTLVCINTKTGRVRVEDMEEDVTTAEDRDEATAWVIEHLQAIKLNVSPLQVRDMLWKP